MKIEMNEDAAIAIIAVIAFVVVVFLSIAVWADKQGPQCKCQQAEHPTPPTERVP